MELKLDLCQREERLKDLKINSELRFEIMTTCCAALGGGLVAAAVSWFSPWKEWTAEVGLGVGILCCVTAVAFHLLVRELGKAEKEGYFRRGSHKKNNNKPSNH